MQFFTLKKFFEKFEKSAKQRFYKMQKNNLKYFFELEKKSVKTKRRNKTVFAFPNHLKLHLNIGNDYRK